MTVIHRGAGVQGYMAYQKRSYCHLKNYTTVPSPPGKLKLNIGDAVPPVHRKHRRVFYVTNRNVEKGINNRYDICEDDVNTHSPLVSTVVLMLKRNDPGKPSKLPAVMHISEISGKGFKAILKYIILRTKPCC